MERSSYNTGPVKYSAQWPESFQASWVVSDHDEGADGSDVNLYPREGVA